MIFDVKTELDPRSGEIAQHVDLRIGDAVERIHSRVLRTEEEQARNALIRLGWTPPGETRTSDAAEVLAAVRGWVVRGKTVEDAYDSIYGLGSYAAAIGQGSE